MGNPEIPEISYAANVMIAIYVVLAFVFLVSVVIIVCASLKLLLWRKKENRTPRRNNCQQEIDEGHPFVEGTCIDNQQCPSEGRENDLQMDRIEDNDLTDVDETGVKQTFPSLPHRELSIGNLDQVKHSHAKNNTGTTESTVMPPHNSQNSGTVPPVSHHALKDASQSSQTIPNRDVRNKHTPQEHSDVCIEGENAEVKSVENLNISHRERCYDLSRGFDPSFQPGSKRMIDQTESIEECLSLSEKYEEPHPQSNTKHE